MSEGSEKGRCPADEDAACVSAPRTHTWVHVQAPRRGAVPGAALLRGSDVLALLGGRWAPAALPPQWRAAGGLLLIHSGLAGSSLSPPPRSRPATRDDSWGQRDLGLRAVRTILEALGRPLNSLAQGPDLEPRVVIAQGWEAGLFRWPLSSGWGVGSFQSGNDAEAA